MHTFPIIINNDFDKHIQAKTSDKRVRSFGDILAPLLREKWETSYSKNIRENSLRACATRDVISRYHRNTILQNYNMCEIAKQLLKGASSEVEP